MPNCFRLFPKEDDTIRQCVASGLCARHTAEGGKCCREAVPLSRIDDEICARFGWSVHPVRYAEGWFNTIGWGIAVKGLPLGSTALRNHVEDYGRDKEGNELQQYRDWVIKLCLILEYLEQHYTSDAWVEIGRRA